MLRYRVRLFCLLLLLIGPSVSRAANDIFLDLSNIKGESTADGHEDEIDVLGWSLGVSFDPAALGPSLRDVAVTKYVDKASVDLLLAAVSGELIPEATLTLERSSESPFEFFKVVLSDVIVTGVHPGGSVADDRPTEFVSLRATGQVSWEYTPQTMSGEPGATIKGTYKIPK